MAQRHSNIFRGFTQPSADGGGRYPPIFTCEFQAARTTANSGKRWFKGWAQAWLVHMRDPVGLFDDLGPRAFAVMQLMLGGMLASALLHPVIFATAIGYAIMLLSGDPMHPWQIALFIVDVVNLSFSYGAFLYLGWRNVLPTERPRFWKLAAWTPIYWMMLSYAAWCAMLELIRTPHYWNKTPHKAE